MDGDDENCRLGFFHFVGLYLAAILLDVRSYPLAGQIERLSMTRIGPGALELCFVLGRTLERVVQTETPMLERTPISFVNERAVTSPPPTRREAQLHSFHPRTASGLPLKPLASPMLLELAADWLQGVSVEVRYHPQPQQRCECPVMEYPSRTFTVVDITDFPVQFANQHRSDGKHLTSAPFSTPLNQMCGPAQPWPHWVGVGESGQAVVPVGV